MISNSKKIIVALSLIVSATISYAVFFPKVGKNQNRARDAFKQGLELYNDYEYTASVDFFLNSLSYNPNFNVSRRLLGQALYFAGDVDEAVSEWNIAFEQKTYDPSLQLHLQNITSFITRQDSRLIFDRSFQPQRRYNFKSPTFVATLPDKSIFFLSLGLKEIGSLIKLDTNGDYVDILRRVSGKLEVPIAAVPLDDVLFISDYKRDVLHRFQYNKLGIAIPFISEFDSLGGSGSGPLQFHGPAGLCALKDRIYAVDSGNNRIQSIAKDGTFLFEFNAVAQNMGLNEPFGIACSEKSEKIYVSEIGDSRISVFDRFGNFLEFLGQDRLKRPRHMSFSSDYERLIIADESGSVIFFDISTGKWSGIDSFERDSKKAHFFRPYSAVFDSFGSLLVADYGAHEVLKFVPEHNMYSNLDLWVERVYNKNFPKIGVWVSVKDQSRNFINQISGDNFRILENNSEVGRLGSNYLRQFENQLTSVILISRSKGMLQYWNSLDWLANFFLKNVRQKDEFKIVHYDDVNQELSPWSNSPLRLRKAINERTGFGFANDEVQSLGTSLYRSVSQLLDKKGKRAVLWISDGNINSSGFIKFSLNKIEHFARNNHIRIFALSFENPNLPNWKENRQKLKKFVENTGGAYYSVYQKLNDLDKQLRKADENRYVLVYESIADKSWSGQYMDIQVEVKFQNRKGVETFGYFIP